MNLDVFLSLFSLMLVSLLGFFAVKETADTLYRIVGYCRFTPGTDFTYPVFSFITSFELTPELLFFVFLPILIFESAYNMNFRSITENIVSIGMLAIFGLLVSTLFVGVAGFYVFKLAVLKCRCWFVAVWRHYFLN